MNKCYNSKVELLIEHYKPETPIFKENPQDKNSMIKFLERHHRVTVCGYRDIHVTGHIRDLVMFHNGFLLLTREGKLWQFIIDKGAVIKTLLPVMTVTLIGYNQGHEGHTCAVMTKSCDMFEFKLPFVSKEAVIKTENCELTRDQAVSEITDTITGLAKAKELIQEKREILEQLEYIEKLKTNPGLTMLEATSSVTKIESLSLTSQFEINLSIKNTSDHCFLGRYWKLSLKMTRGQDDRRLSYSQKNGLPLKFKPEERLLVTVKVPEEYLNLSSLPLEVTCDLALHISRDSPVIWVTGVMTEFLDSLDFAFESTRIAEQKAKSNNLPVKDDISKVLELIQDDLVLDKEQTQVVINTAQVMVTKELASSSEYFPNWLIKLCKNIKPETGSSMTARLCSEPVSVNASLDECEPDNIIVTLSSSCKEAVLSLKRSLMKRKLIFIEGLREVRIPKSVLANGLAIKEELTNNINLNETSAADPNAKTKELYKALRSEVSLKLI